MGTMQAERHPRRDWGGDKGRYGAVAAPIWRPRTLECDPNVAVSVE